MITNENFPNKIIRYFKSGRPKILVFTGTGIYPKLDGSSDKELRAHYKPINMDHRLYRCYIYSVEMLNFAIEISKTMRIL